jgi:hypothetical protein
VLITEGAALSRMVFKKLKVLADVIYVARAKRMGAPDLCNVIAYAVTVFVGRASTIVLVTVNW